ncbi:hypothetical protein TEU_10765 [Thermococcus eurythermalis]|uniref:Uncharacterized protein n=1 Tax=Thermococcus eurythermalis TaxID=1505907 RepID=A0A097QWB1_9EURY|nr:hypothetical protein [Thermococcus eurythermalis]AIU70777.1 hypothetical protein TEU_10765 [Thermococcus eurythermalis]
MKSDSDNPVEFGDRVGSFKAEGHEVVVDVTPCGKFMSALLLGATILTSATGDGLTIFGFLLKFPSGKKNHRPFQRCSHVHSVAGVDFRFLYPSLAVSVSFSR